MSLGALWLVGRAGLWDTDPRNHRAFVLLADLAAEDAAADPDHPRRREALAYLRARALERGEGARG